MNATLRSHVGTKMPRRLGDIVAEREGFEPWPYAVVTNRFLDRAKDAT